MPNIKISNKKSSVKKYFNFSDCKSTAKKQNTQIFTLFFYIINTKCCQFLEKSNHSFANNAISVTLTLSALLTNLKFFFQKQIQDKFYIPPI